MRMDIITIAKAREKFRDVINSAYRKKERIIISRRGKGVGGIIPVEDLEVLDQLENDLDIEAIDKALADPENKESILWDENAPIKGYEIRILPTAKKELLSLPMAIQMQIRQDIYSLAGNRRPPGVKTDFYTLPLGDHHILYQVRDEPRITLVIKIGYREIYKKFLT